MTIQYCSDLHLEFPENEKYLKKNPIQPEGEILLLAGDVLPFALNHNHYQFFDFVSDNFEAVYWIPGNHEFYGTDAASINNPLFEKIRSNVFLVNNHTVNYKDVNIICSTLWSFINPVNELHIQKCLTDFFAIQYNGKHFSAGDFNSLHQQALLYIKKEININSAGKNIVLTHHVPTLLNYPPKYKRSSINEAFVVELFDFIENSNINYWIYGHHHANVAGFNIGNTKMLTNQLGYVRKHEHASYKKNAIIEI